MIKHIPCILLLPSDNISQKMKARSKKKSGVGRTKQLFRWGCMLRHQKRVVYGFNLLFGQNYD